MPAKEISLVIKNYLLGILIILLFIRFLLSLLSANENSPFVKFINSLVSPFIYPFHDILPAYYYSKKAKIDFSLLFAIIIYLILSALLTLLINLAFNL